MCFYFPPLVNKIEARKYFSYRDIAMGEGLQNLVLCSKPTAFEQGGIFIVPHLLWHGTLVGGSRSQDHPKLVAFHDKQRKLKTYEELWLVRLVIKHLKWWNIYLYDFWNFQLILNLFFFTQKHEIYKLLYQRNDEIYIYDFWNFQLILNLFYTKHEIYNLLFQRNK